ncbi:hypothetical protein ACEUZ9_001355 [Paracoccus litorisediminis]|uniref:hypothetical protein n=1 Tax=Paracoccus litorisediminis TaxID=2006130 RepID=UPI0037328034
MNVRLRAIHTTAAEIARRHDAGTVPGGFVGDGDHRAPTAGTMARRWAERALHEDDPETAKALLDQAISFDRYAARDALAQAAQDAESQRRAGGKARAAQRPDLAALVREKALQARERRQRPFTSASETARAIVDQVNIALDDLDALPVTLRTIRGKVPARVGTAIIFERR